MKRLLHIALLFAVSPLSGIAQSDPVSSQYFFNKQYINPAYSGAREVLQVMALYRNQWASVEGSPETYLVSFQNLTSGKKIGYGANFYRDRVGPTNQYGIFGSYAYRFLLDKGALSLGIQAGVNVFNQSWGDLTVFQAGDTGPFGNEASQTNVIPNFGLGIFYQTKRLSAGFGIPHLLRDETFDSLATFQRNAYYLTFDYLWEVSEVVALKPSTLLKFSKGVNAQWDINLNVMLIRSIDIGVGFRTDNSWIFAFSYLWDLNASHLRIGYAYDLANNDYRDVSGGAHEIILIYELRKDQSSPKEASLSLSNF